MIIEKLKMCNFGIYKDSHIIDLDTKTKHPIVLIKALNGYGKTTILTAIQVALHGRLAPVVKDSKKKFNLFIRDLMNSWSIGVMSLEMDISIPDEGKRNYYTISRSWEFFQDKIDVNETFLVKKNGLPDSLLIEKWAEFIEGLLPMNILPFFFFDGEKIEAMADMVNSANMLKTSIFSLFGMDIVSKLHDDLIAYNYRLKANGNNGFNFSLLSEYRDNLTACIEEKRRLIQDKAALLSKAEHLKSKLEKTEENFLRRKGSFYNKREILNQQLLAIKKQLEACYESKNAVLAAEGPFLLVQDYLSAIEKQAKKEIGGDEAKIAGKLMRKQSEELLALLEDEIASDKLQIIKDYFNKKQDFFSKNSKVTSYLNLSRDSYIQLLHLQSYILPKTKTMLDDLNAEINRLLKEEEEILSFIQTIPSNVEINTFLDNIKIEKERIEEIDYEIIKKEEDIKSAGFRLNEAKRILKEYLLQNQSDDFNIEKKARIQQYSLLVQDILEKFRDAVTAHHLETLKDRIKQCFNKLLHKKNFIAKIFIDTITFKISIIRENGDIILPENLSAGERQLLATAIFWALSIESGIEAPVIIDTPLGRLDSLHRKNIVQNYFPKAGKQVILLSTDQEITDDLLAELGPNIAHHYAIEYNEELFSSLIKKVS